MKILIVGSGPAGLTLANFLDTKKHAVTIIEKEKTFSTMGFGIFFFNEGKRLLRKATHDKSMQRFLKQIGYKRYFDENGKLLGDTHYNHLFHVNSHDAITSIKREDLHRLLLKHVPKNVRVKMGTTVTSINNTPDGASVTFSDGHAEQFDLVVGADGSHSMLRERFFSYKEKKLPWIARYFWLDKTLTRYVLEWGPEAVIMCMPHQSKTTVLSIEYAGQDHPHDEQRLPDALTKFYTSMGLSMDTIHACYRQSYVSPMRYIYTNGWSMNRVILIGDAQHAMTPTLGFGTSTAMDDAYALAAAINPLISSGDIEIALQTFAKKRSRKIRVLRIINRCTDFLVFRRSKLYFRYWYKHRMLTIKITQCIDWLVRLGWKYGERLQKL